MSEQSEAQLGDEIEVPEPELELEGQEEIKEEEQPEQPKQTKSQNAKQRLRRKLRQEEALRQQAEERERQLQERLNSIEGKIDKVVNPPQQRPSRVNYETEEEYEDALFDWRDSRKEPKREPQQPKPQKDELPQVDPDVLTHWQDQMETALDKYDDFEEAMISIPPESMTDAMTFAIMESDQGGEIAYFLGNNHKEASRIARLSVASQVREIDKLGQTLKPKQTSKAPPPIKPEKGGDSPAKDPEKMSPEEYRDYRRKQGMGY